MATRMKLMKLLQEMHAFAELGRRNPAPKNSPLFLLQLRSHMAQTNHSRLRLVVNVDLADRLDFPHPVKISHIKPGSAK
jgi:hypothetical protein